MDKTQHQIQLVRSLKFIVLVDFTNNICYLCNNTSTYNLQEPI